MEHLACCGETTTMFTIKKLYESMCETVKVEMRDKMDSKQSH